MHTNRKLPILNSLEMVGIDTSQEFKIDSLKRKHFARPGLGFKKIS